LPLVNPSDLGGSDDLLLSIRAVNPEELRYEFRISMFLFVCDHSKELEPPGNIFIFGPSSDSPQHIISVDDALSPFAVYFESNAAT
jgi:hypothetical protein